MKENVFKTIYHRFFNMKKDIEIQEKTISDNSAEENIYGYKSGKELKNGFKFTHKTLKNRIIVPSLLLFNKLFGKKIRKEIPDNDYYLMLKLWKEAVDRGLYDWNSVSYRLSPESSIMTKEEFIEKKETGIPNRTIRIMNDTFIHTITHDTAYNELFNFIMFNYVLLVNETYGEHGKHLLFSSRQMNDASFFLIMKEIKPKIVPALGIRIKDQIDKFNNVKEKVYEKYKKNLEENKDGEEDGN